jgi:hypothetical protein
LYLIDYGVTPVHSLLYAIVILSAIIMVISQIFKFLYFNVLFWR